MKTLVVSIALGVGLMLAIGARGAEHPQKKPAAETGLPRLVDFGADKCIPCKAMAPILEDLKKTYAGKLQVEFIDVWKKPEAAKPYKIKLIPTQIFYDNTGKERFRHEGFFSKEDILAKWRELGVDLKAEGQSGKSADPGAGRTPGKGEVPTVKAGQ